MEIMKIALQRLVGEKCWSSVAGEGTGSIFSLKFGDQFKLDNPISNPHLSEHEREYDSHLGLMVWSSWSLSKNGTQICDSECDNSNDGLMVTGLKKLVGNNIKKIECDDPVDQICLHFEGGYALNVFCDGFELYGDDDSNYVVFLPGSSFSATTDRLISQAKESEMATPRDPSD